MGYHRFAKTGHVIPGFYSGVDPDQPHKEDHDVRAHLEGYIIISAIKPRWSPPTTPDRGIASTAESFEIPPASVGLNQGRLKMIRKMHRFISKLHRPVLF